MTYNNVRIAKMIHRLLLPVGFAHIILARQTESLTKGMVLYRLAFIIAESVIQESHGRSKSRQDHE
jgi:hypothetical protein